MYERPWLARCVRSTVKKLAQLFPYKTPEKEVRLPWPQPITPIQATALILWKHLPIDTYKLMRTQATCLDQFGNDTGFTVDTFLKVLEIG